MAWPTSFDTFGGTTAQGTNLLTTPDHSLDHRALGSFAGTAEHIIGLSIGTPVANTIPVGLGGGSSNWQQTWNAGTLGTPTIGTITVLGTTNALGFSGAIQPSEGTIVDVASGTLTVNAQAAQIYYSVIGTSAGNRTIGTPTNPSAYQQLTYAFKTSGSANGTLVWPSIFRLSQNIGTPTLGTGVTWNYFAWRYNAIDTKWDYTGQSLNLI